MRRLISSAAMFAVVAIGGGDFAAAKPHGCPPGLAKKNAACAPPGLTKRWAVGRPLPRDLRHRFSDWRRYGLAPPPRGHEYYRVDGDVLLVLEATHEVIEAVFAIDRAIR